MDVSHARGLNTNQHCFVSFPVWRLPPNNVENCRQNVMDDCKITKLAVCFLYTSCYAVSQGNPTRPETIDFGSRINSLGIKMVTYVRSSPSSPFTPFSLKGAGKHEFRFYLYRFQAVTTLGWLHNLLISSAKMQTVIPCSADSTLA